MHPHRLISAYVICFLDSIISKLVAAEILFFKLETGVSFALLETPKTGFVARRPIVKPYCYLLCFHNIIYVVQVLKVTFVQNFKNNPKCVDC